MGRVQTDPVPRFLASSRRVGAMSHFGRQVSFQWIFLGVLLLVGFLGLRWAALSEAQAQEKDKNRESEVQRLLYQKAVQEAERALKGVGDLVAPLAQKHFLEKGKSYYFTWQNSIGPAVVLEEPRENWVKVRVKGEETDEWINLTTVHRVMAAPQAGEKKEADKKAIQDRLKTLTQACEMYHLNNDAWPPSLAALAKLQPDGKPPILAEKDLLDPWGKPYGYDPAGPKNNGQRPDIWVKLPDGSVAGNWPLP
jgi:hypothetical protein